jgi:hypothetical protein
MLLIIVAAFLSWLNDWLSYLLGLIGVGLIMFGFYRGTRAT